MQITEIIKPFDLEENQKKPIIDSFGKLFIEAHKLSVLGNGIKVTSEDQTDEMKKARELRLKLQKVRTDAAKIKTSLKEGYLRGANGIQAIYNDIKKTTEPIEEYLRLQEKFAEIKKAERLEKRFNDRIQKLSKYVEDISLYSLKEMSDETFDTLLENSKKSYEKQLEAERQAELQRKAEELKNRVYSERREKLLPYSDFVDVSKLTRDTTNTEFNNLMKSGVDAKNAYEKEREAIAAENKRLKEQQEKERLEQEEKLNKEREAREKAEAKLKAEKQLQEKIEIEEKQRIENQKRLEEEQVRKKLLAPDKDKLMSIYAELSEFSFPAVQTDEAQQIMNDLKEKLVIALTDLKNGAEKL